MKSTSITLITILIVVLFLQAEDPLEMIVNEEGVYGYEDTPYLPWIDYRIHDNTRPRPPHVEAIPTTTAPPSDATVLFEGKNMNAWSPSDEWSVKNGLLVTGKAAIYSKQAFGDCQIHLEFMVPDEEPDKFSNRGNNGIGLMGLYEIQIFDSHPMHEEKLYADGQCAAIYGETPPLINACREPGEWQSYDITFTAPVFEEKELLSPAYVTVYHNGVLVHNHESIRGPVLWRGVVPYKPHPSKLPLGLMGHGSKVAFRNIWVRPLN